MHFHLLHFSLLSDHLGIRVHVYVCGFHDLIQGGEFPPPLVFMNSSASVFFSNAHFAFLVITPILLPPITQKAFSTSMSFWVLKSPTQITLRVLSMLRRDRWPRNGCCRFLELFRHHKQSKPWYVQVLPDSSRNTCS